MEPGTGLFSRHAEQMAVEALADTRVVVVNGARQVGKSTLAELMVARSAGTRELYLDDQAVRSAAEADPNAGEQQLSFGDRLTSLPMAALWTLDGSVA